MGPRRRRHKVLVTPVDRRPSPSRRSRSPRHDSTRSVKLLQVLIRPNRRPLDPQLIITKQGLRPSLMELIWLTWLCRQIPRLRLSGQTNGVKSRRFRLSKLTMLNPRLAIMPPVCASPDRLCKISATALIRCLSRCP